MNRRRTRIVATIGPASSDEATFERMVTTGMDAASIKFSRGECHAHAETIGQLHSVAARPADR